MNYKEKLQKIAYFFGYACALCVVGSIAFLLVAVAIRLSLMLFM